MELRRITTGGNWIPEIDGLRFVAIASVVLGHIMAELYQRDGNVFLVQHRYDIVPLLADRAGRGVAVFFAISGFILSQPFVRQHLHHGKPVSLPGYFKRRLTRLEPPYILSLLIYGLLFAFFRHPASELIKPFLLHLFYIHNLFPNELALNFVTWSLEVEVQFYILAPLLGLLFALSSPLLRRGIMVALILASSLLMLFHFDQTHLNLAGHLQYFLVGFLLADLRATQTSSWHSRYWDIVSLLCWAIIFGLPWSTTNLLFPPCILLAFLGAFNGNLSQRFFRTPAVALTGGMCYSFYLMHLLVISAVFAVTRHLVLPSSFWFSFMIQVALITPAVYVLCTAYYLIIERPCMDPKWPHKLAEHLKRRFTPRQPAVHSDAP